MPDIFINGALAPDLDDEYQKLWKERANATTDDQIEACDRKIVAFRRRIGIDPKAKSGLSARNIETIDEFLRWLDVEIKYVEMHPERQDVGKAAVREASKIAALLRRLNPQLSKAPAIQPDEPFLKNLCDFDDWAREKAAKKKPAGKPKRRGRKRDLDHAKAIVAYADQYGTKVACAHFNISQSAVSKARKRAAEAEAKPAKSPRKARR